MSDELRKVRASDLSSPSSLVICQVNSSRQDPARGSESTAPKFFLGECGLDHLAVCGSPPPDGSAGAKGACRPIPTSKQKAMLQPSTCRRVRLPVWSTEPPRDTGLEAQGV